MTLQTIDKHIPPPETIHAANPCHSSPPPNPPALPRLHPQTVQSTQGAANLNPANLKL